MKYDLERKKWDISNRKCLMVAKSTISDAIRGPTPDCDTATEYLKKVESQFTGSSKAYASTLIKKLFNEKYTGGGIREHILNMSNTASKLKPMDLELKDEFLIHLVFASLPKEYETFVVNYNMHLDKWDIEKLIAMCVQEKERLKSLQGDSANLVKDKKRTSIRMPNIKGKPLRLSTIRRTTMLKLRKISINGQEAWTLPEGLSRLPEKSLLKRGGNFITFIDESLYLSYAKSTW